LPECFCQPALPPWQLRGADAGVDVEVCGFALGCCATVDAASETPNGQPGLRSSTKAAPGLMAAVGRIAVVRLAELVDGNAAGQAIRPDRPSRVLATMSE
jgi:hypothetical protein